MALLVGVWTGTDGRYRFIEETAGGVHFVIRLDRMDPDNPCLIMRPVDVVAALKPHLCE